MQSEFASPLTSVTRWLLVVVIGCALLAGAQPMNAGPEPVSGATPTRSADTIIYPQGSPERAGSTPITRESSPGSGWLAAVALLLAMGGAWVMVQRRRGSLGGLARSTRKIAVEESRSLGNRQYLVVASYEGKKFLLGVTPGQIQLLSPLGEAPKFNEEAAQ